MLIKSDSGLVEAKIGMPVECGDYTGVITGMATCIFNLDRHVVIIDIDGREPDDHRGYQLSVNDVLTIKLRG